MRNRAIQAAIKAGAEAAKQFTVVGVNVDVIMDGGGILRTKTRSLPWQLGWGGWVIAVEGISGGFDINRVNLVNRKSEISDLKGVGQ